MPLANTSASLGVQEGTHRNTTVRVSGAINGLEDATGAPLSTANDSYTHNPGMFSRIDNIPPEIMRAILLYAAQRIRGEDARTPTYSIAPNSTQVCRLWRDIAISTPFLWNLIKLDFRGDRGSWTFDSASEQLARSGSAPVRLTIFIESCMDLVDQEHQKVLRHFSTSCSAMEVIFCDHFFEILQIQLLADVFPRLKMLTLTKAGVIGSTLGYFEEFQYLSHLRMKLIHDRERDIQYFMNKRWSSLKSLIIDETPEFLITDSFNASFPELESLFVHADHIANVPTSPFGHTNLRTLGISVSILDRGESGTGTPDAAIYRLLDKMNLPSLKTLVISATTISHVDFLEKYDESRARPLDNIELLTGPASAYPRLTNRILAYTLPRATLLRNTSFNRSPAFLHHYSTWSAEYIPPVPL
ncbi:hypothetical protein CONPUDRAFT_160869 [Coniophora puteana RWD-64-598 SS2]|uniref:Uncharacterized protein n=1 Tax=Coniophora puteana (strain RWD-64-598) TaxID=741705 RepID=A0A5M3N4H7_CONPW|nr:uncharacterized protein CONPUDRAFT_160869 [Coniophora puteana RWD-64-598 SS2]EIW85954.1 hypothetical protein CONPUDRAFT_160869 [Coniophora puteana RWD-64-598 SS2]